VRVPGRSRLSRSRRWLVAGVVVVVAAVAVTWWTNRGTTAVAQTITATAATGTYKTTVSASGTVAAAHEADLSFGVSGTVTDVRVAAGDKVAKGQVLATVDRTSLRAALAAARSSLTAARSQLGDDVDADASDTQLAADRAAVLSADSAVNSAEDDLASGALRSTIGGTVASVGVAVGDQVSSGSSGSQASSGTQGSGAAGGSQSTSTTTSTSTSAVTVVSTKAYVVDATVASSDVASVKKGLQAQVTVTGLDATVYGTVSSVGVVAQTSTSGAAEFPVEIAVTGSPKGLYPGSTATASIVVKQVTGVLTVPTQALHTSGSTTYVTEVVAGKNVRRTVVTGTAYGPQTQVKSGLKAGDVVVLAAFTRAPGAGTAGTGRTGTGRTGTGGFPQGGFGGQGGFGQQGAGQ
jgi:multidrug efflux pump subunit AcrA (membrane-fusion protein)